VCRVYPVGTVVQLDTEELGIVLSVNRDKLLRPKVLLIPRDPKARRITIVDLMEKSKDQERYKRNIRKPLQSQQWNAGVKYYLRHLEEFLPAQARASIQI